MNLHMIEQSDLIALIIVLTLIAVTQFYRGRKLNLILIEFTARKLEEILKPKDKNYQWVGLYVGYKAMFNVNLKNIKRVEAVITLMPRQSLLYYPIALITSRHDKLVMFFRYKGKVRGEAHLVKKHYYRLGIRRIIKGIEKMAVKTIKINGKTYYLIYNDYELSRKLVNTVLSLKKPTIVNHIAVVQSNNSLYLAAKVVPKYFEELIENTYLLAQSID